MYRYDPARGGVYDDSQDDDRPGVPAIAADTSVTPDARPPTFQAGTGGVSGMAAPSVAPVDVAGAVPPAGPGAIQPFKLKESSWSTTTPVATPADAATQAARDAATADEVAAIARQGEIGAQQKELEAGAADQKANFLEQKNQHLGAAVQEFDETEKKNKADLAAAEQEQRATIRKEGWDTLGTGGKVIASLAIMLNGIARGIVGDRGPDQVLGLVMENIHRKEEAQAAHIAGLAKKIESLKGPAREQAQKILDGKFATNTARTAAELEESAAALDALAARNGAPGVVEKSKEMSAKLRAEAADKRQAVLNELRQKRTQGGGNKEVIPSGGAKKDLTVQSLDGKKDIGVAYGPEESIKVHEAAAAANGFLGALKRYRDHLEKYGRTFDDDPAIQNERNMLKNLVVGQMTIPMKSGVLNGNEAPRYTAMVDTPWRGGGGAAIKAVDALMTETQGGYEATARGLARLAPNAEAVPQDMRAAPAGQMTPGGFGLKKQPAAPARAAAPAAPQATKQLRDRKTGAMVTAYQHADGQWYPEP